MEAAPLSEGKCYLRGESELSSAEIVTEINKLFRAALPLYR